MPLVYIVLHQVPLVYIVLHHHLLSTTLTVAPPSTSTHGLLEFLIHLDTGTQDNKGTEAEFAQVTLGLAAFTCLALRAFTCLPEARS